MARNDVFLVSRDGAQSSRMPRIPKMHSVEGRVTYATGVPKHMQAKSDSVRNGRNQKGKVRKRRGAETETGMVEEIPQEGGTGKEGGVISVTEMVQEETEEEGKGGVAECTDMEVGGRDGEINKQREWKWNK